MFRPVSPKLNVSLMEEDVLRYWKSHHVFEKTGDLRKGGKEWVFYEGPPTANGLPGVHHALARAFKDIFPRYRVMRGYHVIRRGGWDTHGLPVEIGVEKKLGFNNKSQIEAYGIAKFNELCRQSAFEFIREWERFTDRLGFWVSFHDAYVTYKNEYIESIWWILKSLWDRGLLYQGYKVVPYCPRCGTPLSDHEVAQGYADAEDPSIYVRLPLVDEPNTSLLVWTTTPWTLPGNVAVAAHPDVDYVTVERDTGENGVERLILAKALVSQVFADEDVKVVSTYKGKKLRGKRYKPLFTFLPPDKPAYYVVLENYVTTTDGTGLVHTAPAFGAEDMQAANQYDLPVLMTVRDDGSFISEVTPWSGQFVKDADPFITADLEARGLLFKQGTITHTYPFCWRCDTPLLYYARGTWYIATSKFKQRLVDLNDTINWVPEHIKKGRFGNWLDNNIDWALGRERYWGTPLPVWECDTCRHQLAVGSIQELSDLVGEDLSALDLHRPHVDNVRFTCPSCDTGEMNRVPEVIDVWFDSGAMPVAQWHYPYENQEEFQSQFPADFICEAVDQTRGWFYSLHAISTMLFDDVSFKNVICLGLILDAKGRKMSKSLGNIIDPWDVLNEHGADAFRWYLYTASPPGQERRFSIDLVGEVIRNFTLTLWNVYSFFVTYANLDNWKPAEAGSEQPLAYNDLDRWVLSELHTLVRDVTMALDNYDVPGATRPIQAFVDGLSKWYLRRSRRRFWKSGSDADKRAAYATLYETLVTLSKLLAPTMPFLADELYRNLAGSVDYDAPRSVHLADWPLYKPEMIDEELNRDMHLVMQLASLGLAARAQANVKVRQPLAEMAYAVSSQAESLAVEKYAEMLLDELNVKAIRPLGSAGEAVSYSLKPLSRQLGQKYKALFPKVAQAINRLDPMTAGPRLLHGDSVEVTVDDPEFAGAPIQVLPDEVEVRAEAKSGLVVASEGPYLAALKTELTRELFLEGLAREFIRRVQDLRKTAGFEISDRIQVWMQATPMLAESVRTHQDYIMGETLAIEILSGASPQGAAATTAEFDGEEMTVGILKAAVG